MIERHLGLRFGSSDSDSRQLRQMLAGRMSANERSCADYLELAEIDPRGELAAWASGLTVNETYFLRHVEQFNALTGVVLPARQEAGADPARLRLLSAGCATGDEPYSLAIALRQHDPASQPWILGVDIDASVFATARQGRYSAWSLRALPAQTKKRWFTQVGDDHVLDPAIRSLVRFEQRNIVDADPMFWRPKLYDVVFCRNTLMYLAPHVMAQVVSRISESLAPGGFLFLGSAETLRGMSDGFELCESHGAFYYQRSGRPARSGAWPRRERPAPNWTPLEGTPGNQPTLTRAVTDRPVPVARTAPDAATPELRAAAEPDLAPELAALDLLNQERFGQALTRLTRAAQLRADFDETFTLPPVQSEPLLDVLALWVGDEPCVIHLRDVAEVVARPVLTVVPGPEPALLGLTVSRGHVLAAYDLSALLGGARSDPRWMVVPASSPGIGLTFSRFDGYQKIPPTDGGPAHLIALSSVLDAIGALSAHPG